MKREVMKFIFLMVILVLISPSFLWGEAIKVFAISGPDGNYVFWNGKVLPSSIPGEENWIGYVVYRKGKDEKIFKKITEKPVRRVSDLNELKRKLGAGLVSFIKLMGLRGPDQLWEKILESDSKLLRLSFLQLKLRFALGLGYVDKGVEKDKIYDYYVIKVDKKGRESKPSETSRLSFPRLLGPVEVKARASRRWVKISWKANPEEEAFGYIVYRSTAEEGYFSKISPLILLADGENGFYYDVDVQKGYLYHYYVVSSDIVGNISPPGKAVSVFFIDKTPPSVPKKMKIASVPEGVKLSWEAVKDKDLAGYNLYRSEEWSGDYKKINKILIPPEPSPSYIDRKALPGKFYYYQVTAVDSSGSESSPSVRKAGIFKNLRAPLPPQQVRAEALEDGILVSWTSANEPDVKGYYVFRAEGWDDKPVQISPLLSKDTTSYIDKSSYLNSKGTYWYMIKTINTTGLTGPFSVPAVVSPIKISPPEPPLGLYSHVELGLIRLFWKGAEDSTVVGYKVYKKISPEGEFELITEKSLSPFTLSYEDRGVEPGKVYFYYVTALDRWGNESKPGMVLRISMPLPLLPPPSNLRARNTEEGILIKWDKVIVKGVSGYKIYKRVQGGDFILINEKPVPPERNSYLDKEVKEGIKYFYAITTLSISGLESDKSAEVYLKYMKTKGKER